MKKEKIFTSNITVRMDIISFMNFLHTDRDIVKIEILKSALTYEKLR